VTVTDTGYRTLSFWHDTADDDWEPRAALPGDRDADVAIVGAGFTGLWTAYYLAARDPSLRIVVLEKELAGFGASGRNGGWSSALFPASIGWLARRYGRDPAARAAPRDAGVGRRGGPSGLARASTARGRRAAPSSWLAAPSSCNERVTRSTRPGGGASAGGPAAARRDEARERVDATGVLAATYTPHCAAIHPARLVRGLAGRSRRAA